MVTRKPIAARLRVRKVVLDIGAADFAERTATRRSRRGWTKISSRWSFDPDVKELAALTREQRRAMIQALLADRFQLKSHMETRTLPVYKLVIAKGGVKFKESTAAAHGGRSGIFTHNTELTASNSPIAIFTNTLSDYLHRAVIDKTGFIAKYGFALKWTRDEDSAAQSADAATDAGPSLFTAVEEQLGLKLQAAKGPVQVLVVDQVEQTSEN